MPTGKDNVEANFLRFCLIFFHTFSNVHLVKDPGKIPEVIARQLGWETQIVRPNQDILWHHDNEISHVRVLDVTPRKVGSIDLSLLRFLWENAHQVDVLLLYYFDLNTWVYGTVYKQLNPGGFLWNKLDLHEEYVEGINFLGQAKLFSRQFVHSWFRNHFVEQVDLMTAESTGLRQSLLSRYPELDHKLVVLPNGIDELTACPSYYTGPRERLILNVARLGTEQKATDILLEAFARSRLWPEWKLVLVGPIAPLFRPWLSSFAVRHPEAWQAVQMVGLVSSRQELADWYARTQVFCFPSRYEGFPLALLEAGYYGCACISSNFYASMDMLDGGRCGALVTKNNVDELAQALARVCRDKVLIERYSNLFQRRVRQQFTWERIVQDWYSLFAKRRGNPQ